MKKTHIFFIILYFVYACEKNISTEDIVPEELKTFLIVDKGNIRYLDTILNAKNNSHYQVITFPIDLDSDGTEDISFYIKRISDFYLAFYSDFEIHSLNDKLKIITNDSILTPKILEIGDTLNTKKSWKKADKLSLLDINYSFFNRMDTEIIGNWYNISNKYIGFLIENENNPTYGWVKLSIPETGWITSLTIHEVGYIKAVYD